MWSRRVLAQGAVVLLITDGLDRDAGAGLEREIERLHKSCRRLIWLNPLLRYEGYAPIATGSRALIEHVDDFRPVHNLESLAQLTEALDRFGPRREEGISSWRELAHAAGPRAEASARDQARTMAQLEEKLLALAATPSTKPVTPAAQSSKPVAAPATPQEKTPAQEIPKELARDIIEEEPVSSVDPIPSEWALDPLPVAAVSREEMADVLQAARSKARRHPSMISGACASKAAISARADIRKMPAFQKKLPLAT